MAKYETKTKSVHPSEEATAIDFMQNFGWELKNNQEVYNKNTRYQDDFWSDDIVAVTETEHYIKLTFQRDQLMPQYDNLVKLESLYNASSFSAKPKRLGWWMFVIGFLLIFGISGFSFGQIEHFILGAVSFGAGVALIIWRLKAYAINRGVWELKTAATKQLRSTILDQCDRIHRGLPLGVDINSLNIDPQTSSAPMQTVSSSNASPGTVASTPMKSSSMLKPATSLLNMNPASAIAASNSLVSVLACPSCGASLEQGDVFCEACGHKVATGAAPQVVNPMLNTHQSTQIPSRNVHSPIQQTSQRTKVTVPSTPTAVMPPAYTPAVSAQTPSAARVKVTIPPHPTSQSSVNNNSHQHHMTRTQTVTTPLPSNKPNANNSYASSKQFLASAAKIVAASSANQT